MATIKFTNNYIRVNCDPTVKSIDLLLTDKGEELPNNSKFSEKTYSGESKKAVITYKTPPPAPTTYSVGAGIPFPDGAQVTITGESFYRFHVSYTNESRRGRRISASSGCRQERKQRHLDFGGCR